MTLGSTLTLTGSGNTAGTNPCGTIWNMYPVDTSGAYKPGSYTIKRQTSTDFDGIVIAPEGKLKRKHKSNRNINSKYAY